MSALQSTTDLLRLLSDPTRVRLLALLAFEELTVAELTTITQLRQSRVSTHLGRLKEAGLVRVRRQGTSSFYRLNQAGMGEETARLWAMMLDLCSGALLDQDRERAEEVLRARHSDASWADTVAGQMDRHYSPGRTWEASARSFLGLARLGDVLDVASGDGAIASLVAPRARSVTCLDISERVVGAARKRLADLAHVRFVHGDMHELPFEAASFDAVLLMNCLTYAQNPPQVVREAARVIRPCGLLVGVTLAKHEHTSSVTPFGHVNQGVEPSELRGWLTDAGFDVALCEVTGREKRAPHFDVITFHAERIEPEQASA